MAGSPHAPVTVIIPARMASERFPGKVLASETGWPLIRHVWERARLAASVERVVIATDDARVQQAAAAFGAECVMTSPEHANGTMRIEEAARCWRQAAEWDPNLPSPWLNLGRLTLLDGDPAEAIRLLERASSLAPNAPEPYYSLSLAHRRLGQVEEAERYRRQADQLKKPNAPKAP